MVFRSLWRSSFRVRQHVPGSGPLGTFCHGRYVPVNLRYFSEGKSSPSRGRGVPRLLPTRPARTRFAPSPTGHLHLGSLRTALFNYLLARKTGGQFILRIEDTDRKRTVPGAQDRLCRDLRWAGLQWDEGPEIGGPFGPYNQSERNELYQQHAQELLQKGVAYRCFCPADIANTEATDVSAVSTRIGGCHSDCQHLEHGQVDQRLAAKAPFVVRFAHCGPIPTWTDLIYGTVAQSKVADGQANSAVADAILLKSDGTPTYHLANVIDDHNMEITHVIRGTEWMSSTPLHVALYNGFGWQPPIFAHVGLLTDAAGNKLSKRNFDTDVTALTTRHGILPEALNNFLALMGWSNPEKSDVRDLSELVKLFDMKFTKGNSIVSLDKLWFLQRQHARRRAEMVKRDPASIAMLDDILAYLTTSEPAKDLQDTIPTILGSRTVRMYLQCIVIADAGNYADSSSFLEKSDFYFTTSKARTSTSAEQSPPPLSHQGSIDRIVRKFFDDADCVANLKLWNGSQVSENRLQSMLADANSTLSSKLNGFCLEEVRIIHSSELDNVALKRSREYKELSQQLHDFLRLRLTFKKDPGPASVMMMVILGYDEARRRVLG